MRYQDIKEAPRTKVLIPLEHDVPQSKIDNFANIVSTECSEIVGTYKRAKGFIYRGVETNHAAFKANISKTRDPLFLDMDIHKKVNKIMAEMGFDAHRGNSIFTSSSPTMARAWGTSYIVFPHNGFEYTWFKNKTRGYVFNTLEYITDDALETYEEKFIPSYEDYEERDVAIRAAAKSKQYKEFEKQYIKDALIKLSPTNKNLVSAIQTNRELLITGDYYYAIHISFETKIKKALGI